MSVPSDIEIAQQAKLGPSSTSPPNSTSTPDDLDLYGKYKAKIPLEISERPGAREARPRHRRSIRRPPGKARRRRPWAWRRRSAASASACALCIREPSLGPVFGVKGGAAGGGYAQVLPMDDINLHFTGDFHAISSAHALLAAMLDNHLQQGNALGIDPRRITWPRTIDMNDRALRKVIIGLGGAGRGRGARGTLRDHPRQRDHGDRRAGVERARISRSGSRASSSGSTYGADRKPVRAGDLKAAGAMALLLKDAIRPNLVQTLEGGPAFVHAGPFGNIAHGCNSVVATRSALALADIVVTEAGFGSDLGAEKFFDIKCRFGWAQSRSGGPRGHRSRAQDERRRRQDEARHRGSRLRSSAGCRTSSITS